MGFIQDIFRTERTSEEVVDLLNALLNRTISDGEWDDFISVKIKEPKLEQVREHLQEIWTEDSPFRVPGSIDPCDLNPKGVTEIQKLIYSINK